ncbi:hypothetical protein GQ44DRAFT_580144, partial [Phaeosphaeriaceae sp. PMI808]
MSILPEFFILMRRAIADHSAQIEGFRLRCQWDAAYESVLWMKELTKMSFIVTAPGGLMLEHILDSYYPNWRLWAYWMPDIDHIKRLANIESQKLTAVLDIVALDGPDILTGSESTLREGLIKQYIERKPFVRWRSLVVEVASGTKDGLRDILGRVERALVVVLNASDASYSGMFNFFKEFMLARPIVARSLDIFEAIYKISDMPDNHIFDAIHEIYLNQTRIRGQHILHIQTLVRTFHDDRSGDLRAIIVQDWLRAGIENCLRDCKQAVRAQIDNALPWTYLAIEYHTFCTNLKATEDYWSSTNQETNTSHQWPSMELEELKTLIEIYDMARVQQSKHAGELPRKTKADCGTQDTAKELKQVSDPSRHPLEGHIEAYCFEHLLGEGPIRYPYRQTMTAFFQVWNSTSKPFVDVKRRELAILVSKSVSTDRELRCKCLAEIASGQCFVGPGSFLEDLINILNTPEGQLPQAILAMTNLLVERKTSAQCWREILYMWLEQNHQPKVSNGSDSALEHLLQALNAAEWFAFTNHIKTLFSDLNPADALHERFQSLLKCGLFDWTTKVSKFENTLTRLEVVLGENQDPVRYILAGNSNFDIKKCLLQLSVATPETADICLRIWDAAHGELNIPGMPNLPPTTDCVLGINFEAHSDSAWKLKLTEAMGFWEYVEDEIIREAARLENLQRALKKRDPTGTALLLQELGIPDNDFLSEKVKKLPARVIDMVKIISGTELEIRFPLSTVTGLQRQAMGIPTGAHSLQLRLILHNIEEIPPSFCLHFSSEKNLEILEHLPWTCSEDSKSPHKNVCTTTPSAFTWQLSRILHTQLRTGNLDIADLYKVMEQKMTEVGHACISCGTSHNAKLAKLRRATPCSIVDCARLWYKLPLEVRIPEIKTDTFAVDAMLTSVYVAAMSG